MALDFPSSPAVGAVFAGYVWNGTAWRGPMARTALPFNRIVNPAMQHSQQNLNVAQTASGTYPADASIRSGATDGVAPGQRVQVITPNGSRDRLRMTVTTIDASITTTQYTSFAQIIEGLRLADFKWGTAGARQAILRFGFKGPAGTYSVGINNSANDRSYVAPFTISAGQANTDVEIVIVIPGDTSGTWLTDTGRGLVMYFMLATGTTYQTASLNAWIAGQFLAPTTISNGMASLSNVFELFDVGLYLDPYATGVPPLWEMPDPIEELRACQRYWYRGYGFKGFSTGATAVYGRAAMIHPVQMRIAPTPTLVGTQRIWDGTVNPNVSTIGTNYSTVAVAEFDGTTSAAMTAAGRPADFFVDSEDIYVAMNARP